MKKKSFDEFSVLNIISMKRSIKEKDKEIGLLKNENIDLRANIIKITTSFNQKQTSANFFGISPDVLKLGVEPASQEEIEEKTKEDTKEEKDAGVSHKKLRLNIAQLEEAVISKFIDGFGLKEYNFIREAKLVSLFEGVDPISNIQPIFDGYISTYDSDIFLEIKSIGLSHVMLRDKIYSMLNKLYFYNKVSEKKAIFVLILVETDNAKLNRRNYNLKAIYQDLMNTSLLQ